jgi:hypothetical protein
VDKRRESGENLAWYAAVYEARYSARPPIWLIEKRSSKLGGAKRINANKMARIRTIAEGMKEAMPTTLRLWRGYNGPPQSTT